MEQNREHQEKFQVIAFLIKDFLSPLQVRSAVNEVQCSKVAATAKILHKLIQNAIRASLDDAKATNGVVLDAATSDKYRKIRLLNKTINEKVVKVPGAVDLLTAVGFAYDETDSEKYLIFVPDSDNIALANLACVTLREDLDKFEQKETESQKHKKMPSKADNDENVFLSEKERKERRSKALKAKKAEKEARELAILRWNEDKSDRIEAEKRKQHAAKKAALTLDCGSDQSHTYTKIRKLSTSGTKASDSLTHSNNPNELLQSLRMKAQAEWQRKHGMDTDDTDNDKVVEEPTVSNVNHDQDTDTIPLKPAAKPEVPVTFNNHQLSADLEEETRSPSWEECLKQLPRCAPSQKIRDTSTFYKKASGKAYATSSNSPKCFRRLFAEFDELKSSLPSDKQCSAWLRFDEETPQYLRALLTAPLPGPSPYAGGVFAFDIFIPDDYPMVSPRVKIVTTGQGTVRFGPNLYADGKVCLSLLGTWEGPKWDPKQSSLYQVLVSIQSLILGVEHPYYLEPSYGWEGDVKEGDFATVGHILGSKNQQGGAVKEETMLPSQVWEYEDRVRIGTIRFAMIEPLLLTVGKEKSEIKPSAAYLLPFEDIIKAHFYHNRNATLASVLGWLKAPRPPPLYASRASEPPNQIQPPFTSMSTDEPYSNISSPLIDTLKELFQKLKSSISQVCRPSFSSQNLEKISGISDDSPMDTSATSRKSYESKKSEIDRLRDQMQEAAEKNNFILAGQLQNEINQIEEYENQVKDLAGKTKEAAAKGDYISAGQFQAQLKALQKAHNETKSSAFNPTIDDNEMMYPAGNNQFEEDSNAMDEELDEYSDNEDYSFDGGYGANSYRHWGSGQQLGQKSDEVKKAPFTQPMDISLSNSKKEENLTSRLPITDPCKLRIRLPGSGNESVLEIFDGNEKLSVLYNYLKYHVSELPTSSRSVSPRLVQLQGFTNNEGKQAVGVYGGAFANPYSEYGFTLLSAHPKREFSLEMHGSMSLIDLGLTPSATLTMMRTGERGQVKRGILESKLGEAQGDAMDVEGLNYEALQELGEKIGIAAPGDGTWKGVDESALEKISTVIKPKDYLSQKLDKDKNETNCPICLGAFDTTDTTLLQLKYCRHTFHSACLMTWLNTKTNCPLCKTSLLS